MASHRSGHRGGPYPRRHCCTILAAVTHNDLSQKCPQSISKTTALNDATVILLPCTTNAAAAATLAPASSSRELPSTPSTSRVLDLVAIDAGVISGTQAPCCSATSSGTCCNRRRRFFAAIGQFSIAHWRRNGTSACHKSKGTLMLQQQRHKRESGGTDVMSRC